MTWEEDIAHDLLVDWGETFPADPEADDTWCLSHNDLTRLILCAIERVIEFQEKRKDGP